MMDSTKPRVPELGSRIPGSFATGFAAMVAVMLALPLTQRMTMPHGPTVDPYAGLQVIKPPKELWVPPPPPPVQKDEDIELVDETPKPLQLTHLDVFFNPDISAYASTDWRVPSGIDASLSEVIHAIGDLTDPPRPIRRPQPLYPPELRRAGIEGSVIVMFVVRSDGSVSNIEIQRASHPAFAESVIKTMRKWRFAPGEKDGKAVHTRVRQAIPFRINPGI